MCFLIYVQLAGEAENNNVGTFYPNGAQTAKQDKDK